MASAIGIDVGTTNVKVALVRDDGEVRAAAARALVALRDGERAEQDPDALWAAVASAIAEVAAADPSSTADVVAIAVCSQYSSIVPVDAAGAALGPLLLWSDHRGADRCLAILGEHSDAFLTWIDHHGIPPIGGGLSLAHVLHLQHDRSDLHERAAAYLEVMDLVNLRLTGTIAATQATMFTSQLCDNRTSGATTYDDELVAMAGVDPTRLPPLVALDAVIGPVLPGVAAELGLPDGVVVCAGTTDTHGGAVATGALAPGRGGLAIGTTSVLLGSVPAKAEDLEHEVLSMPGPFPGDYLVCAENGIGGAAVAHVLEELVHATDVLGDHGAPDPFASLDAVLEATEPGAGGVLFLPWLSGSLAPSSDASMRGAFLGLSLSTRRVDLVRAAAEGVAHNLAWLLPHVEAFGGAAMDEITFVGGAARSPQWCQVLADVLDRPVRPTADPQRAVARAMGLLALVHTGHLERSDLAGHVRTVGEHAPDPAHHAVHVDAQERFEAAFEALRPLRHAPRA